ncbi:MAG TPA: hypothetical protein IAA41_06715 [Candidatus Eubacterium faecavium]|nr:hypothetical protein [Candidatus Eubacterium faecavium]
MSNRDFDEKDLMKDVDELYKVNGDSSADQHENMPGAESESIAERAEQNEKGKAKRKPRKVVFTTKQVILAVVISVIAVLAIGATIIFTAIDVNPISYIAGEITQNKLVNKWQSQSAPGLTAYEFYDDGTYTSYLSTYTFDGEYEVNGDKITLKNTSSNQTVTYKYSIVGDTLTLTLLNQNGSEMEGREPAKFDRVDTLNQKSLQDLINNYRSTTTTQETTTQA